MSRRWALVLGASSGFGAATCRAMARAGFDVIGVHLDRRSTQALAEAVKADVESAGRKALFFNINAASDEGRAAVMDALRVNLDPADQVVVLLHSLAFGTLVPLAHPAEHRVSAKQLSMTLEVMGTSLLWWTRDLLEQGFLRQGSRIFAMTSAGSQVAIPNYGPVSAAKSVLESIIRQLAVELAPLGVTANAVLAGVTDTPAARRIPGWDRIVARARETNPHGRLTTPEDVAMALVDLAGPGTAWITGNTIRIDGGESIAG